MTSYSTCINCAADKQACADAVMDLPASFIPNRQTMESSDGEGCICWEEYK